MPWHLQGFSVRAAAVGMPSQLQLHGARALLQLPWEPIAAAAFHVQRVHGAAFTVHTAVFTVPAGDARVERCMRACELPLRIAVR